MIYIDYPVFKMYAHPDVYSSVIDYIQLLIDNCLQIYGSYSVHVNLESFTISAAERYRSIVDMFYAKTADKYTLYFNTIESITIYYTPNSISEIIKIFRKEKNVTGEGGHSSGHSCPRKQKKRTGSRNASGNLSSRVCVVAASSLVNMLNFQ
jgi:hypothetical protein